MSHCITIPLIKGVRHVGVQEIVRIQGLGNYSKVYLISGYPITVAKVLHWFESRLPPDMFARVHRAHLINTMFVSDTYRRNNDGVLLLHGGDAIPVSRRRRKQVWQALAG